MSLITIYQSTTEPNLTIQKHHEIYTDPRDQGECKINILYNDYLEIKETNKEIIEKIENIKDIYKIDVTFYNSSEARIRVGNNITQKVKDKCQELLNAGKNPELLEIINEITEDFAIADDLETLTCEVGEVEASYNGEAYRFDLYDGEECIESHGTYYGDITLEELEKDTGIKNLKEVKFKIVEKIELC